MFRKYRVALAALSAVGLTLTLAGPGSAMSSFGGHNTQTTGGVHCNDNVVEGIISARIKGYETRVVKTAFKTDSVNTFVKAQIDIGGTWYDASSTYFHHAHLGIIHKSGGLYVKPWVYDGRGQHPRFGAFVTPVGFYRIVFTSTLWDSGIHFATLRTVEGYCKFV
jgi:hypothetical protein